MLTPHLPWLCSAKVKPYIASMGIYVMKASALKDLLMNQLPDANDFGNEVIPGARAAGMKVRMAYACRGVWAKQSRGNRYSNERPVCMTLCMNVWLHGVCEEPQEESRGMVS